MIENIYGGNLEYDALGNNIRTSNQRFLNYEALIKTVVEIKSQNLDLTFSCATGIFIKSENEIYLLTNKHVLCNDYKFESKLDFLNEILIVVRQKDGTIINISVPLIDKDETLNKNVKLNSRNYIDIAIIKISKFLLPHINELDILPLSPENFLLKEQLPKFGIITGETVFASGYMLGQKLRNNSPLTSRLLMADPISNTDIFNFPNNVSKEHIDQVNSNFFKVNGPSFIGMSGGPILAFSIEYPTLKVDFVIIGIVSIISDDNIYLHGYYANPILDTLNLF